MWQVGKIFPRGDVPDLHGVAFDRALPKAGAKLLVDRIRADDTHHETAVRGLKTFPRPLHSRRARLAMRSAFLP